MHLLLHPSPCMLASIDAHVRAYHAELPSLPRLPCSQLSAMVVRLGKLDAVVKRQTGLPVATQAFVSRSARLLGIAAHAACGMPEAGRQLATDVGAAAAACMAGSWMVVLRHLSAQEPARAAVEAGVMLACCARVLQASVPAGSAGGG